MDWIGCSSSQTCQQGQRSSKEEEEVFIFTPQMNRSRDEKLVDEVNRPRVLKRKGGGERSPQRRSHSWQRIHSEYLAKA
ncbi:unnamed protein product [Sphagnum tenellum]